MSADPNPSSGTSRQPWQVLSPASSLPSESAEPLALHQRLSAVARAAGALLAGSVAGVAGRLRPMHADNRGGGNGPPDLDELWKDFNRKLNGLFGGNKSGGPPGPFEPRGKGPDSGGGGRPRLPSSGMGVGLILGIAAAIWLASGVFIVQEGSQAVVTSFGRYAYTTDAGLHWRLPYPFQAHETVPVSQLRSVDVGRSNVQQATGLRDSSMLTQDENIIDIRFTVQYRLKDAREYLYENNRPDEAVLQAAESAVREIVGRSRVDQVLYEQRDAIAADLAKSVQAQLDRLKAGVLVVNVNVQSVQVPEQVEAAFNDAVKAGADRDRLKNEGQAYASDVVPKARGAAARLKEEAEGYRQRVIAQAEGDADRFRSVQTEYAKAPAVTRERMYLETMQQVMSNVTKVYADTRAGSLLNLPLDKLVPQGASGAQPTSANAAAGTAADGAAATAAASVAGQQQATDPRSRENTRSREREGR